jgi:hypothetical protein
MLAAVLAFFVLLFFVLIAYAAYFTYDPHEDALLSGYAGSAFAQDKPKSKVRSITGYDIKATDIVRGEKTHVPTTGRHLIRVLEKSAPRNESRL